VPAWSVAVQHDPVVGLQCHRKKTGALIRSRPVRSRTPLAPVVVSCRPASNVMSCAALTESDWNVESWLAKWMSRARRGVQVHLVDVLAVGGLIPSTVMRSRRAPRTRGRRDVG